MYMYTCIYIKGRGSNLDAVFGRVICDTRKVTELKPKAGKKPTNKQTNNKHIMRVLVRDLSFEVAGHKRNTLPKGAAESEGAKPSQLSC